MIRNEITTDVARPVAEVFQTTMPRSSSGSGGIVESRRTIPGVPGVGTRFEQVVEVGGPMAIHGELIAYKPNRRLGVRLTFAPCEITVEYAFEAVHGGTRVRYLCTSRYYGVSYRLLSGVILRVTQRKVDADFRKTKTLLEVPAWAP